MKVNYSSNSGTSWIDFVIDDNDWCYLINGFDEIHTITVPYSRASKKDGLKIINLLIWEE